MLFAAETTDLQIVNLELRIQNGMAFHPNSG